MLSLLAATDLDVVAISVGVLGGLALFLFGMGRMTDALKMVAGGGMRLLLDRLTKNRFLAAITGAIVTGICQSSSVTTVLLVGFISAGLMTLPQAIGVIMGANVGSTVTAQLIAFNITAIALPMITIGFAMEFLSRREKVQQFGAMVMGLGLIFYGMGIMSQAAYPLRQYEPFIAAMRGMDHVILAITASALITAIIQSSAATTGIVIVLAGQGYISLEAGIALALGANIGTCVTAVLAALGKPVAARQAAAAHVLFNVVGVLIWAPLIPQFAELVRQISPSYPNLPEVQRLAAETPRQIANAHTTFNIANTLLFIWFTGPIARAVQWLLPARPAARPVRIEPKYLDASYLTTPSLALDRVRLELGHLGEHVLRMMELAPHAVAHGTRDELRQLTKMDEEVDALHAGIVDYIRRLAGKELSDAEAGRLESLLAISDHLESAGDLIETTLVAQGYHRLEHDLSFSRDTSEFIRPMYEAAATALRDSLTALENEDVPLAQQVIARKPEIHRLAERAYAQLTRRLLADAPNRVEVFRVESEIITQTKRFFRYARRIAKVIVHKEEVKLRTSAA